MSGKDADGPYGAVCVSKDGGQGTVRVVEANQATFTRRAHLECYINSHHVSRRPPSPLLASEDHIGPVTALWPYSRSRSARQGEALMGIYRGWNCTFSRLSANSHPSTLSADPVQILLPRTCLQCDFPHRGSGTWQPRSSGARSIDISHTAPDEGRELGGSEGAAVC